MASKFYILTLPVLQYVFAPFALPDGISCIRGQLECGQGGLLHWQFVLCLTQRRRSEFVRRCYPGAHVEVTRSAAANEYVHKDDTYVDGTRFALGNLPTRRNNPTDWEAIWDHAKNGKILDIPADVRIRSYSTLRRIEKDFMGPKSFEREVFVFHGRTGTGKSRRAWDEAGLGAYPKDPNTKFWDGYQGHTHVVIDEFRGNISISNLLRWFDRYPVCVEIKGGASVFTGQKIWITSNLPPVQWYPDLDAETFAALSRRFTQVVEFDGVGQRYDGPELDPVVGDAARTLLDIAGEWEYPSISTE